MNRMGMKPGRMASMIAVTLFTMGVTLLGAESLSACKSFGAAQTCEAIDLAAKTCPTIIKFIGVDGGEQSVSISHADMAGVKADHERKAAAARGDGGK